MQIYKLTNRINGMSYIGATIQGLRQRMIEHRYQAKYNAKFAISRAIREFGMEAFDLEVLAEAEDYERLMQLEIEAIREHGTMSPNGYNNSTGGRGCPGHQKSVEGRMAIAAATRDRILSDEHREAIRSAQIGNDHGKANKGRPSPFKGVPMTAEARARMKAAHVGSKNWNARAVEVNGQVYPTVSDAARSLGVERGHVRNMLKRGSATFLTASKYQQPAPRMFSEEHRAKLAAAKRGKPGNATGTRGHEPWNKGTPRTDEEKSKMRASLALSSNPRSRSIEIEGIVYSSVTTAARELGASRGKIWYWLKSGRARHLSPPHGGEPQKEKTSTCEPS